MPIDSTPVYSLEAAMWALEWFPARVGVHMTSQVLFSLEGRWTACHSTWVWAHSPEVCLVGRYEVISHFSVCCKGLVADVTAYIGCDFHLQH